MAADAGVVEVELTATAEFNMAWSDTFSQENSVSVGTTTGSTAVNLMTYNGPGTMIGWATMDMYEWDSSNIDATFSGQCRTFHPDGKVN